MADTTALKNRIRAAIKANDNQEITGPVLQQTLLDIVDELDLYPELENEAQQRQNADTALQQNIDNEATTRGNADTQLNNIITGIKNNIDNGYVYAGIATPSTEPVSGKVFYIAVQAGTYTNFDNTAVIQGINILKYNGSAWSKDVVIGVDDTPTQGSDNMAKSGGITDIYGSYTENPEFVDVKLDSTGRILWGIQKNGNVYFGAGVPQQIVDYINKKIVDLSLDEYEDIVAFLNGLEEGDKTLQTLLNEKVDKEEGKSLINAEYASSQSVIDNPEFTEVTIDSEDKVVAGRTSDGTAFEKVGFSTPKMSIDGHTIENIENSEFTEVTIDSEDKVVAGRTSDGTAFEKVGFSTPKMSIDGHTIENIEDPEGRSEIITDSEGKIISYRDKDGILHEEAGINAETGKFNHIELSNGGLTDLENALKEHGFTGGQGDWSDNTELHIEEPYCAIVNFIGIDNIPQAKGVNLHGYMQFWDMNGNYFKKEVIMNAQGRSSMHHPKKNIAIDICNNNGWDDDDTFKLQIGDWVPQDSFHLKSFYNDPIKCLSPITYKLYDEIVKTRGELYDYYWKRALLNIGAITTTSIGEETDDVMQSQFTNGAKGFPMGFPCIVYLNGEFYGIYSWQLKKHRDNYVMSKKKAKHIHLDGCISSRGLLAANGDATLINWNAADATYGFEIRNPKDLVYEEPYNGSWKYDADADFCPEIAGNQDGSSTYDAWVSGNTYPISKIVTHNGHLFINTLEGNSAEPIYDKKNNGDDAPDFKNKTGCNWINCTNTVKVKEYILDLSKVLTKLSDANDVYEASEKTAEDIAAFKAVFETYFDVANLTDYLIISDVLENWDGFNNNWQWLTYNGKKWYISIYDTDNVIGNDSADIQLIYPPLVGNVHMPFDNASTHNYKDSSFYTYYIKLYTDVLEQRYKELRDKKIIELSHISSLIDTWINRIGNKAVFKKEWAKWPPTKKDSVMRMYKWLEVSINNNDNLYNYS